MAAADDAAISDADAAGAPPPPAPPLPDIVDRLHTKVTEMCEAYFTSIGHLQSVAPRLGPEPSAAAAANLCAEPVGAFAGDILRLHSEFDALVGELEADHRSEQEQLDAMAALQIELDRANETIKTKVAKAHELHLVVRQAVDSRLQAER
mmetsp:Transcript_97/g.364  ORF Transcript_97/g.364 Transcript_97/m.364 type:complete len:150 (+) Transcript_97:102-551(+)